MAKIRKFRRNKTLPDAIRAMQVGDVVFISYRTYPDGYVRTVVSKTRAKEFPERVFKTNQERNKLGVKITRIC